MKLLKFIYLILLLSVSACKQEFDIPMHHIAIELIYPEGFSTSDSTKVSVGAYVAYTDSKGCAQLQVPRGTYTTYITDQQIHNDSKYYLNGTSTINVTSDSDFRIKLSYSKSSPIIIKELYIGGCPKDDGSGTFTRDAYVILYNNSPYSFNIDSTYCIATPFPFNSNAPNHYLDSNNKLIYDSEAWTPAALGIWHFPKTVTLQSGKQIVIAIYQAINHLPSYSNSVDLSQPNYYCLYDIDAYKNDIFYTTPSHKIATSHYLNALNFGSGSAWPLSFSSPGLFLFNTQNTSPNSFTSNSYNNSYFGNKTNQLAKKVPNAWIIDAVDVFRQGYSSKNTKRFSDAIDAGSVIFSQGNAYTIYRNVDQEATEAIANNKDLLIYNYKDGTAHLVDGSTDPSGIDAEASIANGAHIIYMDSNNSSKDFHQRHSASIKLKSTY